MPRVLVIDDAPELALTLRILLERAGYDVVTASDGRSGLRSFYESRPDLVLLDIRMPVMDGWQTLERLRDLSDVPVLIVSGSSPPPEELARLRPGVDGFIGKPLSGPELVARVVDLLAA